MRFPPRWRFRGRDLDFEKGSPVLMGIINATLDSFSDGGVNFNPAAAVDSAERMLDDGAAIIDIGGESTRPGAGEVAEAEEVRRVVPVVAELRCRRPDCVISIDTRKSGVARASLEAGADIINDISGLAFSPEMAGLVAEFDAGLVLMHMRGVPATMQSPENLRYENLVEEVILSLETAAEEAMTAGVASENIVIDPGIGFSKTPEQNIELLGRVGRLAETGFPRLLGISRKSFIGWLLNEPDPDKRLAGTIGAALWLAGEGVEILRVHDVRAVSRALKVFYACRKGEAD